jgi:hypothetical protein
MEKYEPNCQMVVGPRLNLRASSALHAHVIHLKWTYATKTRVVQSQLGFTPQPQHLGFFLAPQPTTPNLQTTIPVIYYRSGSDSPRYCCQSVQLWSEDRRPILKGVLYSTCECSPFSVSSSSSPPPLRYLHSRLVTLCVNDEYH